MPARPRSRNSTSVACVPTVTISSAPVRVGEQHRDVLAGARRRERDRVDADVLHPLQAAARGRRVGADDDLGAAAQRLVGDRVQVADDEVGVVAGLDQRLGAAVDADQHRPELLDVVPQRDQVVPVVVAAGDDAARAGRPSGSAPPGTPTPSSRSVRSCFMYSMVAAANASSWVDRPSLASISAAVTVSAVCSRPSASGSSESPGRASSCSRTRVPSLTSRKTSVPTASMTGTPALTDLRAERRVAAGDAGAGVDHAGDLGATSASAVARSRSTWSSTAMSPRRSRGSRASAAAVDPGHAGHARQCGVRTTSQSEPHARPACHPTTRLGSGAKHPDR